MSNPSGDGLQAVVAVDAALLGLVEDGGLDDPGPLAQGVGGGEGLDQLVVGEVGDIVDEALEAVLGEGGLVEEGGGIEVPVEQATHDELLIGPLEFPAVVMDVAVAGATECDLVLGRLHSRVLAAPHARTSCYLGSDLTAVNVLPSTQVSPLPARDIL